MLLAISGLAFFYPAFCWLTGVFGTPELARIVHPFVGVVLFVAFARQFFRYWHHNLLNREDVKWMVAVKEVMKGNEVGDIGRYNGGQKAMFWVMVLCMAALFRGVLPDPGDPHRPAGPRDERGGADRLDHRPRLRGALGPGDDPRQGRGCRHPRLGEEAPPALVPPLERFMALKDRRRNMTARTGCGLCGVEKLEAVARVKGTVTRGAAVARALADFAEHQRLHQLTGAVHGVAWVDRTGAIQAIREDVGRHNALDKLIGWLVQTGTDASGGFILTSRRASFEMVQKAAAVGIGCLVAISAPTALAVRLAEGCGLTLVGFARRQRIVVYSHPNHLIM